MTEALKKIHEVYQQKSKDLSDYSSRCNEILQRAILDGGEFYKDNFIGKGNMATFHFHYSDKVAVSIHPLSTKDECEEWAAKIDGILYMVSAAGVNIGIVNMLHRKLLAVDEEVYDKIKLV